MAGGLIGEDDARAGVRDDVALAAAIGAADGAGAAVESAVELAASEVLSLVEASAASGKIESVLAALAAVAGFTPSAARETVHRRASRLPELLALEPRTALEVQLRLFAVLAQVPDVSVWVTEQTGEIELVCAEGDKATTRGCRSAALAAVAGSEREPAEGDRRRPHAVPLRRLGRPVGAVVVRARRDRHAQMLPLIEQLAQMLPALLEREQLLRASTTRDQLLHAASERRLVRVGYDLHDGPLQELAALGAELQLLRGQVPALVAGGHEAVLTGRIDDVAGRLAEVDRSVRELSQALETSSLVDRPLVETLRRDAASFARRTGIDVQVETSGSFLELTASQRIVVLRIAQEALSNVREHSIATRVLITLRSGSEGLSLEVRDNGQGFDVSQTVVAAARRGRLGVVGMSERVRLLGGVFEIESTPGVGTAIAVSLPAWRPASGSAAETA